MALIASRGDFDREPLQLRLAAELAEQKQQLEEQLQTAAPKVDFADRVSNAGGILIGNYAKVVGLGPNFLFTWVTAPRPIGRGFPLHRPQPSV